MLTRLCSGAALAALAVTIAPRMFNARNGLLNALAVLIGAVAVLLLCSVVFEKLRQWWFPKSNKGERK